MTATQLVACNLCGSRETRIIYEGSSRFDTPGTKVVQCCQCDLVYLNPRLARLADNFTMQEAYLRDFYLPFYQQQGLLSNTNQVLTDRIRPYYQQYLQMMQPYRQTNRVLDVGCAIGLFLVATRLDNWEGYGFDPSGPLSAYGREHFGLSIAQGELQTMNFPKHHFDVVTLWNVIEHLFDPQAVLREVSRMLRPGGLLIVQMPNWNSLARAQVGTKWEMFVTDHFYYFSAATTGKMLAKTGYRLKELQAAELCAEEIHEIRDKAGAAALEQALQQLQQSQTQDLGSTITAYAEKPMTLADRVAKAGQLLLAGRWQTLGREINNYRRWKFS
jgi:2-polyprenyl-3-methyl-5-hydroxy-6-metoxy-1,4-benzoquinol methylase